MAKIRKKLLIKLSVIFLIFVLIIVILNIRVSSKQGINFIVRTIKMPLYIKIIEFMDRNYHYKQLAEQITKGCNSNEEKIVAIFKWTHKNIRKDVPKGWPVVDDHVWNIIIRGYGEHDQSADVFATLCVYAGIPAFWAWISPKNSKVRLAISYVKFKEKWRIFDSYHRNFFWNEKGEIASVQDIIANPSLVNRASNKQVFRGIEYIKYFENLNPINDTNFLRARKQKPLSRFFYEIRKVID